MVALSSGEAELYSITKAASQALGIMSLGADLGIEPRGKIHSDANAALGIIQRQRLGKLRHINVQYLWIKDRICGGELAAAKVLGRDNPADLFAKYLPVVDMQRRCEALSFSTRTSRAETAPQLAVITAGDLDNNNEDEWITEKDKTVRIHSRARRILFTPLRVNESPPAKSLTRVPESWKEDFATRVRSSRWLTVGCRDRQLVPHWEDCGLAVQPFCEDLSCSGMCFCNQASLRGSLFVGGE